MAESLGEADDSMTRRAEGASRGLRSSRGDAEEFGGLLAPSHPQKGRDLYVAPQLSLGHRVPCRPPSRRKRILSGKPFCCEKRSDHVLPGYQVSLEKQAPFRVSPGPVPGPLHAQCGPTLPQTLA